MLCNTCISVKSLKMNIFLSNVRRGALCFSQGGRMGYPPDSKVHGANMGPTWVLSSPGQPHVGPINLAIWASMITVASPGYQDISDHPQLDCSTTFVGQQQGKERQALLAFCDGYQPVTGGFLSQRPKKGEKHFHVMTSSFVFHIFYQLEV